MCFYCFASAHRVPTAGSWLEGYKFFERRRRLHFYHHYKFARNMTLGGLDFTVDKLFGSFEEPGPTHPATLACSGDAAK